MPQDTRRSEPEKSCSNRIARRQIKCPATPDNDEREKFVRSANILKKELRGRKVRISPFHQKRLGHNRKRCIRTRHNVPLVQIKMNRLTGHVSVDGQMVIRICANVSHKYQKYQDIEAEVEATVEMVDKKLVATTVSSRYVGIRRRMEGMTMCSQDKTTTHEQGDEWVKGKVEADRVSNTLTVTYQCACETKMKKTDFNQKRKIRAAAELEWKLV